MGLGINIIESSLIDWLSAQAKDSPRLRKNHNLSGSDNDHCQRLLNAIQPGTYIQPHRHLTFAKTETFVCLQGRMALFVFDDDGNVQELISLGPNVDVSVVDLPPEAWHTVVSLEDRTVFFEAKSGPFDLNQKCDMAPWAPAEGSKMADIYLNGLEELAKNQS